MKNPSREGGSFAFGRNPTVCRVEGTGLQLEFTLQRANHAGTESGTLKRELQQYDRVVSASPLLHPCRELVRDPQAVALGVGDAYRKPETGPDVFNVWRAACRLHCC